jgi:hypothetical protein
MIYSFKKQLFSLVFILIGANLLAQQTINATLDTFARKTPLIGFNANGHFQNANWADQDFRDSVATLNGHIFRYPGGTCANYWDWQTGWYDAAFPHPNATFIRAEEFKLGLDATEAEGLFVMNYRNSTIDYQMAGLRHAASLGIPINYVEIGNEHNLNNPNEPDQFVYPSIYGADSKTWADSVRAEFPNSKICLVGGSPPNLPEWHDSILFSSPDVDAFAWHVYINANNADGVFDVNRALEVPFSGLPSRWNVAAFDLLPDSIDVWVTEYNLWETQNTGNPIVISETWTHGLYVAAMNHYFLGQPRISMLLNHSLASINPFYQSISGIDHHVTANGVSMQLLATPARDTDSSHRILFSPSPTITEGATSFPSLIGWKFTTDSIENGLICNIGPDTLLLSLQAVFGQMMDFESYYGDTALMVNGLSSLNKYMGSSSDAITIYPFSLTNIFSETQSNLGINTQPSESIWLYPNPSQGKLNIKLENGISAYQIFNHAGSLVNSETNVFTNELEINTTNLSKGIYFIAIETENGNATAKFVVE